MPGSPRPRPPLARRLTQLALVLLAGVVVVAVGIPLAHERALRQLRHEATSALEHVQASEEAYFLEHGRYAESLSAPAPGGLGLPQRSVGGHYRLILEVSHGPGGPSFFVEARIAQADADPRCAHFSLNREGVRGAQGADGRDHTDDCWR